MALRSFLAGLLGRWEGLLDRSFRDTAAERLRSETARGEFINTLIIEGTATARDREGGHLRRRLGE